MIKPQHCKCLLLLLPLIQRAFCKKEYRTRDRFVETNVYKPDLTTYKTSFCTHWIKLTSFLYLLYISMQFLFTSSNLSREPLHLPNSNSVFYLYPILHSLLLNIHSHFLFSLLLVSISLARHSWIFIVFSQNHQNILPPLPIIFLLPTFLSMWNYCCGKVYHSLH